MSVICNANTLTLETLIGLCEGEYGQGPTQPDHVIVAVNCTWSAAEDVGQFWQRCGALHFRISETLVLELCMITWRRHPVLQGAEAEGGSRH
jgi:hypothetical protein